MLIERAIVALALFAPLEAWAGEGPKSRPVDPLARFDLPDDWEARFWGSPDAVALLEMSPRRLADLVPTQAGLRYCRCPACDAPEADDPLGWSIRSPQVVTCKKCGATFPNDKIPAQVDKKVPEETVEVVPGRRPPLPLPRGRGREAALPRRAALPLGQARLRGPRVPLKAALYAAVRYREQPLGEPDPALARVACVLLLRFAQVYPNYALHLDQPGQPKFLEPAHQPPPYRRGYGTAKWDWSGSLDVPLNLAIAYALVRDDPAMAEAGKLLNDADPARTIEHDLFRASAAFVKDQPRELNEQELQVDRGLLAVARLLRDPALAAEAIGRLREFSERGFYHDGLWRAGDAPGHRRVLGMLDGWIEQADAGPLGRREADGRRRCRCWPWPARPGRRSCRIRAVPEVQQVGWPAPETPGPSRAAGLARRRGRGPARGRAGGRCARPGTARDGPVRRRLDRGGRRSGWPSAAGPSWATSTTRPLERDGWDRASSSHNTVLVDGLNQRETPRLMREAASGGEFLFFAADPDFQVAVLDDPRSYPRSTTRYRQTVVACSGSKARYAVSVFEVVGGLQHDQFFHAAPGDPARWSASVPMSPGPDSLLPPTIPYLSNSQAEDGRWFVQGYGEFDRMTHGSAVVPAHGHPWASPGKPRLRLHLLGDTPFAVVTGSTPRTPSPDDPARSALMLRRTSKDGATLESTFVTVFDPIGPGPGLGKVGRMTETPGFVVLYLETADGPEHLVINLRPGVMRTVQLADGRDLTTDAFVVRAGATS